MKSVTDTTDVDIYITGVFPLSEYAGRVCGQ